MITLDLIKFGKYGFFTCLCVFVTALLAIMFCIQDTGEAAIVWLIYLGLPAAAAKIGLYVFGIMWFVGHIINNKENKDVQSD